jgi:uncharacterized RmlC-like cupin family protein
MAEPVEIVAGDQLHAGPMTPGMSRAEASVSDGVWVGEVRTDPGTMSGWHHHGEHATYGRVLKGSARVEFGPDGATTLDAQEGDFFFVPPFVVHREGNPGDT